MGKRPNARGLVVEIKSAPDPVKLGETRQIDVTLVLRNTSKVTANLKFATSQLIEMLLREPDTGKVVSQWSADHTFSRPAGIWSSTRTNGSNTTNRSPRAS